MSDVVLTDIDKRGVATVTLNRPEVNNAYNGEVVAGLANAIGTLAKDDAVRIILIRGNGKHFQAGADLKWIKENSTRDFEHNFKVSQGTTRALHGLATCPKPTIALIHGGCFGGGTGIAAACDIVVASQDAIFSITEARWGLVATPIVPLLLSRLGAGRTRRYSLTCERFDAKRAFDIGFVDEVCETGKLDETAAPIIDALLHCPPDALAGTKANALQFAGLVFTDAELEEMARVHAKRRQHPEAAEGMASFLEKRKPSWYPGEG
jgi:methylglutaconyl-CoA hydratase